MSSEHRGALGRSLFGVSLALGACGEPAVAFGPARCETGGLGTDGVRTERGAITVGAPRSVLGLADVEQNAVVRVEVGELTGDGEMAVALCSGVLVAKEWVLTAPHCWEGVAEPRIRVAFGGGVAEDQLVTGVTELVVHSSADVAALRLDVGPASALAVPLGLATAEDWTSGAIAEVAGFGVTAELELGARLFAAVDVLRLEGEHFVTSAAPLSGACIGDSGGPLLVRAASGRAVVLGLLSSGSGSCRGVDRYTRLDVLGDFLAFMPPAGGEASDDCGDVTPAGACFSERGAVWCESGRLARRACETSQSCGYDVATGGYRCVDEGADPCQGVSSFGTCSEDVALVCSDGRLVQLDCAACAQTCRRSPLSAEVGCSAL